MPPYQNRVLAALPPHERSELDRYALELALDVGRVLYEAGEPIDYVYFPASGLVSLQVRLSGLVREVGFIGQEGVVGADYDLRTGNSFTRAVVAIASVARRVPLDPFIWAMQQSPKLRELIARNNNRIAQNAHQNAACNLTHHLDARLCRWILQMLNHSAGHEVVFGNQEHLSQILGANRSRLNEALQSLSQAGAITLVRRGAFVVSNVRLIEAGACECSFIELPSKDFPDRQDQ